ncbi:DUF4352 domain-containing protein [Sphingomonas sp. CFBP 13720]|uniref:DUF4352 domain-containing protein n=1 Tax=Sphingomonas sp. CFBP 13720 TaxID=2775302 RepID=UPI0017861C43|nr:DUF4352 domain-containing protein [Sphingomonas sp. CFBP 13720]MBD8679650.1 DUF4352 domain-containing protein [Sphingomonas sp. CFBP 13720]
MKKHITIALAVLLSACGGETGSTDNGATAAPAAEQPVALGKAGSASEVDYTVTAVTTPKQIGPDGVGGKAAAGETYVVVDYTIKNTGDAALPFMERPAFTLVDPEGASYASDDMAGAMSASTMTDPSGMIAELNPGVSAKARAAWKLGGPFDKATWKLVLASDPQLTFALK